MGFNSLYNFTQTRYVLLFIVTSLLFSAFACGHYSFSGSMASHIKSIAIPLFEDRTAEFGIKEELSDALIAEFTRDNTLKIADRRNADSILEGVIRQIRDQAGAYDSEETVQELKVYLTVDVRYFDATKKKVVWEDRLTQWGAFDPNLSGTDAREAAITEAIEKLTTEILNRTVSGW